MPNSCVGRLASAAVVLVAVVGSVAAAEEIDVRSFARAPAMSSARLSPDGKYLSYVEQSGTRQSVFMRSLRERSNRRTLSLEIERERVRWCGWAGTRHLLCGTVSPVRKEELVTERTRLYAIDVAKGSVHELNGRLEDPIRDQVIDELPVQSTKVLLQHDPVGRGYPEVAELDVASGTLRRVLRTHPPVRRWMSDGHGEVRLGIGYAAGIGSLIVRNKGSDRWQTYLERPLSDIETIGPLAFGPGSADLYALKHQGGRAALFHVDLEKSDAPTLLFADPLYDISGPLLIDSLTRRLLAVRYVTDEERTHFFDAAEAALQGWIDEQLHGVVNTIIDRTVDGRQRLVRSMSDVNPPSWYLIDAEARSLTLLGHEYAELEGRALAPMTPMIYRARDGQRIPAYLTLPVAGEPAGLPAIVLPHGGPEARDLKTFDPLVQFLAAQGYAVLQMNFRGSLGYGARFAAAGARQWGGVMHTDITDGARWLVEQRIADPARICIVGRSFGGYAALLGAARETQWYACAASYAGVSDLIAFSQFTERLQGADIWKERLGADQQALWQMSPIARVRTVEIPVLLMHGRNDAVVPFTQSQRFARALRNSGKQHTWVERADCDHDLSVEACRIALFSELRDFLAAALHPVEAP